jgi:hypothetical protein
MKGILGRLGVSSIRRLADMPDDIAEPEGSRDALVDSANENNELSGPLCSNRRGFLKATGLMASAAAINFSLAGVAQKAYAAVISPYLLLDLPLLGALQARLGSTPTIMRESSQGTESDPPPVFAYGSDGVPQGILALHAGGDAVVPRLSSSLLAGWQDFENPAWHRVNVPVCVASAGTASDGTNRLWRFREGFATGPHLIRQKPDTMEKGQTYTLNAIVRDGQVRFVGLQLRGFSGKYYTARFDLQGRSVYKRSGAIEIGLTSLENGLVHIWASFKAGWGQEQPVASLQFLHASTGATQFAGTNRSLYVSEFWMNPGAGAAQLPSSVRPRGGYLQDASNIAGTAWYKSGLSSYEPNAGADENGDNNLWRISESQENAPHILRQDLYGLGSGEIYTLNAILKAQDLRYVGLQLRTFNDNYYVARFDLLQGTLFNSFNALDSGVRKLANGLLHVWASFDAEAGNALPSYTLQLLSSDGRSARYAGSNRALYFSRAWVNLGIAEFGIPEDADPVPVAGLSKDTIAIDGMSHLSPNDCAGVCSFQFRQGLTGLARIWHTGDGDNDYAAISISPTQLIFEKVRSGIKTRCVHTANWTTGSTYRVGWRSSSLTGMELVLNGRTVAVNNGMMARREITVGSRLIIGSDGKRYYSNCPIGNMLIFSES